MTYIKSRQNMKRGECVRHAFGYLSAAVLCVLLGATGCDGLPSILETSNESATDDAVPTPGEGEQGNEQVVVMEPEFPLPTRVPEDGQEKVRLRIDAPVAVKPVQLTIGAPGLWPPRKLEASTNMSVVLPAAQADPYGDRMLTHYEVRAVGVAAGKTYAYWGEVNFGEDVDERTVRLEPAGELSVEVANEAGEPVSGATVRLSRGLVGLVNLAESSDEGGTADFAGLPSGDYRLTVEADEYVRRIRHVLRTGRDKQTVRVELERGSVVRGYVRDVNGRPIPGAEVAIYPESPFADTQVDTSLLAELGVWSQIAVTDFDGNYVARGIGADAVRVGASAPGFAPSLSELVRFGEADAANVDLVLREGRGLRVMVVDETGEPVPDATVSWESLEDNGGRSTATNREGVATFSSVPQDAFVMARLGSWSSRRRNVPELEKGTPTEIQLTLEKPVVENAIQVRLSTPPGVYVRAAMLQTDAGEVCPPAGSDGETWRFIGCEPGPGTLEVQTRARGTHTFQQSFDEANELELPELLKVKVLLEGLVGREWKDASLGWRWPDQDWRAAQFADERTSEKRIWQRALLPGSYSLVFDHPATGKQRFSFELDADRTEYEWKLERRATIPIYVTDAQGMPVENALVQLWRGGEMIREGYSRGATALPIRLTPPIDVQVFAIDARRGEALRPLKVKSGEDVEDVIMRLEDPLLTHDMPPGRINDPDQISEILGVPLVDDGDSWLLDATDSESPAMKAGLERGDRLLWVRKVGSAYSVAVERGRDVIEVTLR